MESESKLWRESTEIARATPSQRLFAAAHAERMKRLRADPASKLAAVPPPAPKPEPEPESDAVTDDNWFWLVLADYYRKARAAKTRCLTYSRIQNIIAAEFSLPVACMTGQLRIRKVVLPRQISMLLCHELLPWASLPQVARWHNRSDHTTVLHAMKKLGRMQAADPAFTARIDKLRERIRNATR